MAKTRAIPALKTTSFSLAPHPRGSSKQSPQSLTILSWVGDFLHPADFIHHIFSPTDFTDIHRFFLGRFFVPQISHMTQIFHRGFIHRISRNLFGDYLLRRLLTDFRRGDLSGRCRYPLRLDKEIHQRFHKKSVYICEICGTKPSHEEKFITRLPPSHQAPQSCP